MKSMDTNHIRAYSVLEVKAFDDEAREITGIATTPEPDRMGDIVEPLGAKFAAELPLLWQHRPDQRIGWIESAGEDERGLRVVARIDAADSAAARALKNGAVDGLSFGYRVLKGRALPGGRELEDLDLFEVSLVTRPMQPLARVHFVEPEAG